MILLIFPAPPARYSSWRKHFQLYCSKNKLCKIYEFILNCRFFNSGNTLSNAVHATDSWIWLEMSFMQIWKSLAQLSLKRWVSYSTSLISLSSRTNRSTKIFLALFSNRGVALSNRSSNGYLSEAHLAYSVKEVLRIFSNQPNFFIFHKYYMKWIEAEEIFNGCVVGLVPLIVVLVSISISSCVFHRSEISNQRSAVNVCSIPFMLDNIHEVIALIINTHFFQELLFWSKLILLIFPAPPARYFSKYKYS